MAQVCKWLSVHLCMRDYPDHVHPSAADDLAYDAVIVWKAESAKEKTGGMAYEVILKPATVDPLPASPPKQRPLSQEVIEKKQKEAEERRQCQEAAKLQPIQKDKERAQEANRRMQELNDSFSKASKDRIDERMESMEDRKTQTICSRQEKLREHAKRICEAQHTSEACVKEQQEKTKQHLEKDLSAKEVNRCAKLAHVQERVREHQKHVEEVIETGSKFSKETEMKCQHKMEVSEKKREEQRKSLLDRLHCREERAKKVRANKLNQSGIEVDESGDHCCS